MKLLIFVYVEDRGPNVEMLMPVEVPDDIITHEDALEWLPSHIGWEQCRYLVIDPIAARKVETMPEGYAIRSRWVK